MICYPLFTAKRWEAVEVVASSVEDAYEKIHKHLYTREFHYLHHLWVQASCPVCILVGGDPSKRSE